MPAARAAPAEILAVVRQLPRARRRALVLETIGFTALGAEAVSEINFRKLCRRYGLPEPESQERRTDRGGRLRYLDARWPTYGVAAEIDGGVHTEPEAWWADMRRQNDVWAAGECLLRFPAWAINRRADEVARQLRHALTAGGWRP